MNCKICNKICIECNHTFHCSADGHNTDSHFYKISYERNSQPCIDGEKFVIIEDNLRYCLLLDYEFNKTYYNISPANIYEVSKIINFLIKLENYNKDYLINKIKTLMLLK